MSLPGRGQKLHNWPIGRDVHSLFEGQERHKGILRFRRTFGPGRLTERLQPFSPMWVTSSDPGFMLLKIILSRREPFLAAIDPDHERLENIPLVDKGDKIRVTDGVQQKLGAGFIMALAERFPIAPQLTVDNAAGRAGGRAALARILPRKVLPHILPSEAGAGQSGRRTPSQLHDNPFPGNFARG